MLKRQVNFMINKADLIMVIDALSSYSPNRVTNMKDGRYYLITLYCDHTAFQKCLDGIMMLSREGIRIWRMDIRYKLRAL